MLEHYNAIIDLANDHLDYKERILHDREENTASEWNILEHKKGNFVSPSRHVMFYLLHKHQWNTKPFYFCCKRRDLSRGRSNGDLFTYEETSYLPVKISCFRAKAHLVFNWWLENE